MRIMLVEDNQMNIAAAQAQITDHELIIARTHDEALKALEDNTKWIEDEPTEEDEYPGHSECYIDVVLTDVMMPKGSDRCMNDEGNALVRRQGQMPYGSVLALRALSKGIKKVGVVTAGNHHVDPFVFAFDNFTGFAAGDVKVICTNKSMTSLHGQSVKDWGKVLDQLLA